MVTHNLSLARSDQSMKPKDEEVLSLEEILAEGSLSSSKPSEAFNTDSERAPISAVTKLNKSQLKRLQEAMYHASECGNVELTLDLRNLGVSWTPYIWIHTLQIAHDGQITGVINELLQDFTCDWLEEPLSRTFFAEAGLPLLFAIFRTCKNEGTVLMLADIFSLCFDRCGSKDDELAFSMGDSKEPPPPTPRIDPRFVNNPELSDVQFRVEGRLFYAHNLALITASPRFQSMLNSRFSGDVGSSSPPVLQINDIRFDIFHLVMTYLYNGGLGKLQVDPGDVLELMAAANFFQLPGLLKHCELLCSKLVQLDNIVSYYIHAKVYSALNLLEFCEGFLLKNLVALLTYDDAVKRLIFGKKMQNHDVLAGMMENLAKRMTKNQQ